MQKFLFYRNHDLSKIVAVTTTMTTLTRIIMMTITSSHILTLLRTTNIFPTMNLPLLGNKSLVPPPKNGNHVNPSPSRHSSRTNFSPYIPAIRKKKNKSPVTCPYCGLVSNSSGSYRRHKMLFHTAADPRPRKAPISQCHLCDLRFGSKTSLATHLSTIHATQPLDDLTQFEVTDRPPGRTKFRNFRCPDCSKVIGQVQNFLNHRLIHSGEKPHPCPTCGLAFRKKGTLQRHCESQHLKEEKKFLCEHCPKSFLFKYTLVAHQNLMHPEGPRASFLCSKCPKEFTLKRNLERHMILVHEQVRRGSVWSVGPVIVGHKVIFS